MTGFQRLFIANRGEVAHRIARTCEQMGITPVFGISTADRGASYLQGHETVCLGPARADLSYLKLESVVQAALQSHCSAVHPGWGFLAENPLFARLCEQHGLSFIGPPAHVMALMGKKIPAKTAMIAAGLTPIPGSPGLLRDAKHAAAIAKQVGYPVLLKAHSGGGGRGMRMARDSTAIAQAFQEASQESLAAFSDSDLYLEKLIEGGRHIEIQILADRYGKVVHFGERDCTVQRNHQKLIEESPAPVLAEKERESTLALAVKAVASIGYVGAGTMEFLLDSHGQTTPVLRFMEMNTRLQVEHSVSEMRSGVDLVREQIRIAAGHPISGSQADIKLHGHAIECRINAEDPDHNFQPTPGTLSHWVLPDPRPGELRIDTHLRAGDSISPHYDSLLCKLITHGRDREQACERMLAALASMRVSGVKTTIPMHQKILASADFRAHNYDNHSIPGWPGAPGDQEESH